MASQRRKDGKKTATGAKPADPQSRPRSTRARSENAPAWLRVVLPAMVAGAAFVTFLPALDAEFVNWDDDKLFLDNPYYRGLSGSHLKWMFQTTKMGHWQPLSWITLGLDYTCYGMNPRGYHLTNMLLHAGCAAAFYFLAQRLLVVWGRDAPSRSRFGEASEDPSPALGARIPSSSIVNRQSSISLAAALAALFFAVHPLRVESVAWVTERRDLLSGLFFILTLSAYLKSRTVERYRLAWYIASIVVFLLSILSKAWGMTIPAILIVLDFYPLRRLGGRVREWFSPATLWIGLEKAPFVVIASWTAIKAIRAQAGQLETVKSLAEHPLSHRAAQVAYGAVFYAWKTLWPRNLIPLYELPYQMNPWESRFVISVVLVVVAAGLLLVVRRRWAAGLALAGCYLAIYSPVSGVAQSGPQLVKDSYSYLCCLSWAVLLGGGLLWCLRRWGPRAFAGLACVCVVWLAVLGVWSWRQTGIWHDSRTLWNYTLSIDDRCSLAYNNLGIMLKQEAQKQEGRQQEAQLQKACEYYRRSLALRPDDPVTLFNLGNCLKAMKRYDEAIECYRQAIAIRPSHEQAHLNLGNTYRTLNRIPEAVEHHLEAARYRRDPELEELIARELRTVGRLEEAETYYRKALKRKPDFFDAYYGLGQLFLQKKVCPEALEHLRKAVELKPDSEEAKRTLTRAEAECRG